MSKILKLRPEHREEALREFEKNLTGLSEGVFESEFSLTRDRRAKLVYEPVAWQKFIILLGGFQTEVGWHGVVTREQHEDVDVYTVHDILVYPQKVTAATVDTDQAECDDWVFSLDPEQRINLRLHGHSHVDMRPHPSTTDDKHRRDTLDLITGDWFYIFQIWNKSFEFTTRIYDLARNLLYETDDVDLVFEGGVSPAEFLRSAKAMVKPPVYASKPRPVSSYTSQKPSVPAVVSKGKAKPAVSEPEKGGSGSPAASKKPKNACEEDEEDDAEAFWRQTSSWDEYPPMDGFPYDRRYRYSGWEDTIDPDMPIL